jgi:hypothetical protein
MQAKIKRAEIPTPGLERWMELDFRLNTLADGDAEDLADGCYPEWLYGAIRGYASAVSLRELQRVGSSF